MKPTLIVGAGGRLGRVLAQAFIDRNAALRLLARPTTRPFPAAWSRAPGVEFVDGDLRDPASLERACAGVGTVIATATGFTSPNPLDSIEAVDEVGNLTLLQCAERCGAERFVFVSFPELRGLDFALQRAKRKVEDGLARAKLRHTVLQPCHFMEVWLSPDLGFDPWRQKIRILGDGRAPVSFIALEDVSDAVLAAHDGRLGDRGTLRLGGPEPLCMLEIAALFEACGYAPSKLDPVTEQRLLDTPVAAGDAKQEARRAFALATAHGLTADSRELFARLELQQRTVRDYALSTQNVTKRGSIHGENQDPH